MSVDLGDGDLVRLARTGDPVAFRLLIERHRPMVRARAVRLSADPHEVDDIVQESFLQAFISLDRLRDPDRFAGWLGGVVLNVHRSFRRRAPVTLLGDWPERLHPLSADGLPSADNLDRSDALRTAIADLPPGQQRAVQMFYYADQPGQIAGSAGAAKTSLHKARLRLREHIAGRRPDLVPAASGRTLMTTVRIAHAEPQPSRTRTSQVLVVLADDAGRRALPVWLRVGDGRSLWRLLDRHSLPEGTASQDDLAPGELNVAEDITCSLLDAAGASVTGVDIDELGPEVTAARADLTTVSGTRQVTMRLADGLALAAAAGAPVRVAEPVMDRLAVPVRGSDLLTPFLDQGQAPSRQPTAVRLRRPRYEPRNLDFLDGLGRWDIGGSFQRGPSTSRWGDYAAAAEDRAASLFSTIAEPEGFAHLSQRMFADDFRGGAVTFRGDLRTEDLAGEAGLFVRVVPEGGSPRPPATEAEARGDPSNHITAMTGSRGWTPLEVMAEVGLDASMISFGIFLTGRGRVVLRHAGLTAKRGE